MLAGIPTAEALSRLAPRSCSRPLFTSAPPPRALGGPPIRLQERRAGDEAGVACLRVCHLARFLLPEGKALCGEFHPSPAANPSLCISDAHAQHSNSEHS